ncbi:MAG: PKD domain-containing protein [Bacteroidetes bacterium]|nr:PKD domain-containing protein [Bacteroidota bacterium]
MKQSLYFLLIFLSIILYCKCTIFSQTIIILQPDAEEGKDAPISDYNPNTNDGSRNELTALAWTQQGIPFLCRGVIEFDLTIIPEGSIITDALLSLFNNPESSSNNGEHSSLSGSNACRILRITEEWDEFTVTWNNQPSVTTLHQVTLPQSIDPHQDYEDIDVTQLVIDMIDNSEVSHGFMIRLITEEYYRCMTFASSDYTDPDLYPKLAITFTAPVADFLYILENKTVYFNNLSQWADTYLWEFGDGIQSIQENPVHAYQQFSDYEVTLIASNQSFADTVTKVVRVCLQPVAEFDYHLDEFTLSVNNTSQNALSYFWDFGDGSFSFLENPTYKYLDEGDYKVSLIAYNDCEPDTTIKYISICTNPEAGFDYICDDLRISFMNTAINYDSCIWDYGDGIGSTLINPEHIYLEPGDYCVGITVWRFCGENLLTQELVQVITVPCSPQASFTYAISEFKVSFTNMSFNATSFIWDFGDGDTSDIQNPVHSYAEIGDYQVQLIAYNDHGSDTIVELINITSIDQILKNNIISIFPNPAHGRIYLKIDSEDFSSLYYQLLNMQGQIIREDKLYPADNGCLNIMDISFLKGGIYYFRFFNQEISLTKKVVIY